ncbi:low molecular weight phosphotyrosine protein phosphatase [Paraburkholderia sabiae]|uniref:protein-tyrosine-phosphatase n=1 Tax=Paraburkholderia sabiae TaxID=273251 RepID=A0ABU9QS85_9BURK|nr:low molecular weight phosphotyrosine protein phosphatase [Paraburkholderia sabiae]WJZ79606.1 low molecular weight phosphotyrosine protein phosphatase [Paraburkholderia sabiae]CAD6563099.1 putative low molecular weight protein-tyrosine-phosphatase AmsI [Paraburkholderia sabiae]
MIKRLLVVCTGNICRSPVVASILRGGLPQVEVSSAGVAAQDNAPVDPLAADVLKARTGFDIDAHRSRKLILPLCEEADVILVMERAHRQAVQNRFRASWGKTWTLDADEDVFDPRGYPRHVYDAWLGEIVEKAGVWADRIAKVNSERVRC